MNKTKIILSWLLLIVLIVSLSYFSTKFWGGKPEQIAPDQELIFSENMTIAEFGQKNNIPNPVLKEIFNLTDRSELQKQLSEFGISQDEIASNVQKNLALVEEESSKNWLKIRLKFASWFIFLTIIFFMVRKGKIKSSQRKILYLIAIFIFGILLSSDPNPMGTVKDAIALYGAKHVIFPPRMIALIIFLVLVVVANKFICSWGCQFGALQDLMFRLNRNPKDTKGIMKQVKIPFAVTNSIRIAFFIALTAIAFLWATDIVEPIDPFKVYNPLKVSLIGGIFIFIMLVASLFVYRPWCHFFCPFGLVGWIFEKLSFFKIKVDYNTCIACTKCADACPSTVMNAILKRENIIPDCFACANCIQTCPTNSIKFAFGKREKPVNMKWQK